MTSSHPQDAPPSYETATGSSSTPGIQRVSTDGPASRTERNGIPPEHRRSMEDETRPLPTGWVRQFDPVERHQFFVDTSSDPPRSTWTHPFDDPTYLSTLSPEERKKYGRMHRTMSLDDVAAESSDDEHPHPHTTARKPATATNDPPPTGIHKLTRKMKDKITSTTHEQRQNQRAHREEQERKAYHAHLQARHAMIRALETGQPQFLCKDQRGRDVYIEPPRGPAGPGGAFGPRGYGQGAYGYNPYSQGPYAGPNARFVRPVGPYGRPNGYGYGGGMGLGAPLAAGILGGALLGGVLF
ncbi:hypothetical protein P280DRAFT_469925 [Massarina eburnea CBS 473.64]|uniref:WW domain-containing protein n=1 Tax=Massarina eburnea CBS 473.64 TaxID=1395130 RepID=A0A6A6RZ17_9PLEO|nr:hypothetical protein P280DRAFT_469925 [Massarina eburnea CBS 473.64]